MKLINIIFRSITISLIVTSMLYLVATAALEQAYFEGQKDAIEGNIRIILVKDTITGSFKWAWLSSPWDSGKKPVYVP